MINRIRKFFSKEDGVATMITAITLPILIGLVILGTDRNYLHKDIKHYEATGRIIQAQHYPAITNRNTLRQFLWDGYIAHELEFSYIDIAYDPATEYYLVEVTFEYESVLGLGIARDVKSSYKLKVK